MLSCGLSVRLVLTTSCITRPSTSRDALATAWGPIHMHTHIYAPAMPPPFVCHPSPYNKHAFTPAAALIQTTMHVCSLVHRGFYVGAYIGLARVLIATAPAGHQPATPPGRCACCLLQAAMLCTAPSPSPRPHKPTHQQRFPEVRPFAPCPFCLQAVHAMQRRRPSINQGNV